MREVFILIAHLFATIAKLIRPGGARAIVAESLLLKHQLLILNRGRVRAPRLSPCDRLLLALSITVITRQRIHKLAVILKPATLLAFHKSLVRRKYRQLFSSAKCSCPGPKGPSAELIAAVLEMKRRNPRFGCPRIALEITHTFGVDIDKDVVRRILGKYFRSNPGNNGPSWLSVIAQAKDSLWSVDFFRCESIGLKSYWVMVVMDVFTRRIIGFGVESADIDGIRICRMFNCAIARHPPPSISAPIMTHYFATIAGSPICAFLKSMKSNRFPIRRHHIPL